MVLSQRPTCLIELCAGTAALTLAVLGGPHARPPVSRIGSKHGYARALCAVMGITLGGGADSVILCEPDEGMVSVLRCYPDPEALKAVAEKLRGWKDREPRELWEALRAEGRAEKGEDVAGWLLVQGWGTIGYWCGPDRGKPVGDHPEDWTGSLTLPGLTRRVDALQTIPFPPTTILNARAEDVSPEMVREVAGWLWVQGRSWAAHGCLFKDTENTTARGLTAESFAARCDALKDIPWPPTSIYNGPAEDVSPGQLLDGVFVMIDPPYVGDGSRKITGYAHEFPRESVIEVANRWSDAGAVVAICECVPLTDDLPGWHAVEITGERIGQRRTFSRQSREWVTINREPAWRPSVQTTLFEG